MASFLKGDAYLRMKPYISARLEAASIGVYTDVIKAVIINVNQFLEVLI
jgi:hypothetical protein